MDKCSIFGTIVDLSKACQGSVEKELNASAVAIAAAIAVRTMPKQPSKSNSFWSNCDPKLKKLLFELGGTMPVYALNLGRLAWLQLDEKFGHQMDPGPSESIATTQLRQARTKGQLISSQDDNILNKQKGSIFKQIKPSLPRPCLEAVAQSVVHIEGASQEDTRSAELSMPADHERSRSYSSTAKQLRPSCEPTATQDILRELFSGALVQLRAREDTSTALGDFVQCWHTLQCNPSQHSENNMASESLQAPNTYLAGHLRTPFHPRSPDSPTKASIDAESSTNSCVADVMRAAITSSCLQEIAVSTQKARHCSPRLCAAEPSPPSHPTEAEKPPPARTPADAGAHVETHLTSALLAGVPVTSGQGCLIGALHFVQAAFAPLHRLLSEQTSGMPLPWVLSMQLLSHTSPDGQAISPTAAVSEPSMAIASRSLGLWTLAAWMELFCEHLTGFVEACLQQVKHSAKSGRGPGRWLLLFVAPRARIIHRRWLHVRAATIASFHTTLFAAAGDTTSKSGVAHASLEPSAAGIGATQAGVGAAGAGLVMVRTVDVFLQSHACASLPESEDMGAMPLMQVLEALQGP